MSNYLILIFYLVRVKDSRWENTSQLLQYVHGMVYKQKRCIIVNLDSWNAQNWVLNSRVPLPKRSVVRRAKRGATVALFCRNFSGSSKDFARKCPFQLVVSISRKQSRQFWLSRLIWRLPTKPLQVERKFGKKPWPGTYYNKKLNMRAVIWKLKCAKLSSKIARPPIKKVQWFAERNEAKS